MILHGELADSRAEAGEIQDELEHLEDLIKIKKERRKKVREEEKKKKKDRCIFKGQRRQLERAPMAHVGIMYQ